MSNVQRWLCCRACGMVKDTGRSHEEYGKYTDQGPYWIAEADHTRIVAEAVEQALSDASRAVSRTLDPKIRSGFPLLALEHEIRASIDDLIGDKR